MLLKCNLYIFKKKISSLPVFNEAPRYGGLLIEVWIQEFPYGDTQ
jgi:hypothetical protein